MARKKAKPRRGNIEVESVHDPFPKYGLVKQYEPFIRKHAREFCERYPGLQYETALSWAVELATEAEAQFKPELGNDFSTFLRPHLKRLHRFVERDQQRVPKIYETAAEKEHREAEEIGERPKEPSFASGGNGARVTIDHQWLAASGHRRVVIGVQLNGDGGPMPVASRNGSHPMLRPSSILQQVIPLSAAECAR